MEENGIEVDVEDESGDLGLVSNGILLVEGSLQGSNSRGPTRFIHVDGFEGRQNDIVYCKPLKESEKIDENDENEEEDDSIKVVVFFGGDIQDFIEIMEMHRDHRNFSNWNLEATAVLLQNQFPSHHIVVVRPNRMNMMTFSCFDNFVPCNNTGVPDHTPNHFAIQHLEALLRNLSDLIGKGQGANSSADSSGEFEKAFLEDDSLVSSTTEEEGSLNEGLELDSSKIPVNPHLDRANISLVGFSKGCVVLNQLLYEFHYLKTLTPDDSSLEDFLSCLKDMYWLDGGHNGGKNTFVTSRSLLETLTRRGVRVHVHMTPYQLLDDRRPWIRKEEKMFSDTLRRIGAPMNRRVHFENESPNLDLHLQILAHFALPDPLQQDSQL